MISKIFEQVTLMLNHVITKKALVNEIKLKIVMKKKTTLMLMLILIATMALDSDMIVMFQELALNVTKKKDPNDG